MTQVFRICSSLLLALVVFAILEVSSGVAKGDEPAARQSEPLILAHYMPWFESQEFSGKWGWHWTMNQFDPDAIGEDGHPKIASHYHPLAGLYDSNDPKLLECHVQQMKLAGFDGVIIDWYGTKDANDYAMLHRNTVHLIKHIRKAGMKYAICYEDQTLKHMVNQKTVRADDAVSVGKESFQWMDENWFGDPLYATIDGRPLLAVFGPQYFEKEQWSELRKGLRYQPAIYSLPHVQEKYGLDGVFGWAPAWGGKPIAFETWNGYLDQLYSREDPESYVAIAFPGFVDIYDVADVQATHGSIAHNDGKTMRHTFERALESKSPIVQIATWNDYGEGTMIEPTHENGYRDLEYLQSALLSDSDYSVADLRLPLAVYLARKKLKGDAERQAILDQASALITDGKCDEARGLLQQKKLRFLWENER
ncbi:glycoside hydrolase family 71/99-like protein [Mariniblastus fucicola]|uniref:Glycosyl hydrolase family 71 n=1 Tax=Mariniblastus fucicola TaxID=980251 RepID=A0A5B9PBP4_9BACT|nr:glycoside hydrolase family 71/99-like protein [Mariniblastus fucicola]QEG20573.1 Glycosyl hydrolase family 71 [Mariniblastus fucicola]